MDAVPTTADRPASIHEQIHRTCPHLRNLRVALVHDWLTGMRGGEKCLERLCHLFPDAPIFTLIHEPGQVSQVIEDRPIQTSWLDRLPNVRRHYRNLLPLMPAASRSWRIPDEAFDVVVSLSHCVAKAVRVPDGIPHICYCFTPMRYAWDGRSSYLESLKDRPIQRAVASALLSRLRDWDRRTANGVDQFIALSKTVRDRIARHYGRDSEIVAPPVDTRYYRPDPDIDRGGFYLCVSALAPYKRIDRAIAACRQLGRRLIVIGDGPERTKLEQMAGPTITMLGWRSDSVIREHYQRCRALLFPGVEDFGIVPIEALACGAPVIALNQGGVAESVTDQVGRLFNDPSSQGLAQAIIDWEIDGRPHDPERARQIAEGYDESAFLEGFTQILEQWTHQPEPTGRPRRDPRHRQAGPRSLTTSNAPQRSTS